MKIRKLTSLLEVDHNITSNVRAEFEKYFALGGRDRFYRKPEEAS